MKWKVRMVAILGAFVILTGFNTLQAELYKWTDENGVVHFTDDYESVPERHRENTTEKDIDMSRNVGSGFPSSAFGTETHSKREFFRSKIGKDYIAKNYEDLAEFVIDAYWEGHTFVIRMRSSTAAALEKEGKADALGEFAAKDICKKLVGEFTCVKIRDDSTGRTIGLGCSE